MSVCNIVPGARTLWFRIAWAPTCQAVRTGGDASALLALSAFFPADTHPHEQAV